MGSTHMNITRRACITGLPVAALWARSRTSGAEASESELIVTGTRAALERTLYAALRERAYPGQFTVTADAGKYGESTWAGQDNWAMAGAYLLAGRHREVLDYFDFVQASQRKDGNIPFVIVSAEKPPSPRSLQTWHRGLRYPEDVYVYRPAVRPGQPDHADMRARKWIGLFVHWQMKANPLGVLAPVCYIMTAAEIFAATKSQEWLRQKLDSLEAAGKHVLSRKDPNGLLGGAGFYLESIPRNQWDGVAQCYGVRTFRELARLTGAVGNYDAQAFWNGQADRLAARFRDVFWKRDHFAEYVHPERGVVDLHGLSEVNWAAVGLGLATDKQIKVLWPILMDEKNFWRGGMPTQLVTHPDSYEQWEYPEPLPFPYSNFMFDVAAMGRVWYLEVLACVRMGEKRRLRQAVINVCRMAQKSDWFWHERYHADGPDSVKPEGAYRYCEYPAVLARTVLGNTHIFPEAGSVLNKRGT